MAPGPSEPIAHEAKEPIRAWGIIIFLFYSPLHRPLYLNSVIKLDIPLIWCQDAIYFSQTCNERWTFLFINLLHWQNLDVHEQMQYLYTDLGRKVTSKVCELFSCCSYSIERREACITIQKRLACVAGFERGRGRRNLGVRESVWGTRPNSPFPFPFQRRPRRLETASVRCIRLAKVGALFLVTRVLC